MRGTENTERQQGDQDDIPLRRVLIASSEIGVGDAVETLILANGRFSCEQVNSLSATLEQVTVGFDVVLLDLALDAANGLQSMLAIQQKSEVPIVLLTEPGAESMCLQCLEAGAQEYLAKSDLEAGNLCRVLDIAMSRHRADDDMQLRLEHTDRLTALGQLTAGVAHEINNPATYVLSNLRQIEELIVGFNDGLATKKDLDLIADMTRDCRKGVELIASISRELKFFARDDDDTDELIDVEELITNSSAMTLNEIRYRAQFVQDVPSLPPVFGSRAKLSQVLINLLINAAHAIDSGNSSDNKISVSAQHRDGSVVIEVSDTGSGMSDEILGKIFDPYFTTKPHGEGTGLGLPICKKIIEQHMGTLTVTSQYGTGTQFCIVLPAVKGDAVEPQVATDEPEEGTDVRKRVLLIDDEPLLLKSLARMLQSHHEVEAAIGGRRALELLAGGAEYDVVICDLMMPDCDGLAVFETIADRHPQLLSKLIFLSGGVFTDRMSSFLLKQNPQLLDKPVSRKELLSAIIKTSV